MRRNPVVTAILDAGVVVIVWLRLVPWWMVAGIVTVDSIAHAMRVWLEWEKQR